MWSGGFLSSEIQGVVEQARDENKELFDQLYRVNDYALSIQRRLVVEPEDVQGLVVATFFSRTINSVQASVILLERGLSSQAKVVLRAAMESLFGLRACLDSEFCERLVVADAVKRKKHFRKAEQLVQRGVVPDADGVLTEDSLAQIEADIAETNSRDLTTADIAKAAGLHDWYLGVYAMFSASVHTTVRDLTEYMLVGDNGEIAGLTNSPDLKASAGLLICSIEQMLMAATAAAAYFGFDHMGYWEREHEALRLLVEKEQAK
ncbi:DUF5677 domain-containing protein [Dyella flava]|uniref:HEPN AbiU2-like domain-containing protein n=1 Tax=Dyella flava TaxID=1920170 RepID=A0ABS2JZG8_9GAMM|nr:DUF5677 domain-containing protein [Dyella flava]MBM7124401.1 hypothetical protein [Dyella flava]GLQ52488.1 hypothetical protein GCM10010872_39370 [Dyella flava]